MESTNAPTVTDPRALAPAQQQAALAAINPFATGRDLAPHVNAATVSIEADRAIAEVKGKLAIAKMFPRDPAAAFVRAMEACRRRSLAEQAFYNFPRGGQAITGPTIRLLEALCQAWGNIEFGMRELSNRDGVTEMESYAWDLETNTLSSQRYTVQHVRDRREGGKVLTDQRDIYELGANMGARRMRGRMEAILPPDLLEAAVQECRKTLAGKTDEPIADRIKRACAALATYGVTPAQVEAYLEHPIAHATAEDIADLQGVFNGLKAGGKVADYFGAPAVAQPQPAGNAPTVPAVAQPPANDNASGGSQPAAASNAGGAPTERRGPGRPRKAAEPAAPAAPPVVAPTAASAPATATPAPAVTAAAGADLF